jgi:hypothetical protein
MLYFMQAVIIGAVMCANVYWQLTPNGYLAALIGIVLAAAFTAAVTALRSRPQ